MKHLNIRITGRVQGVFFRAATTTQAQTHGVKGIVRNEPDGSVYVEAEGPDEALFPFLEWLKNGPPGARVYNVSTEEGLIQNHTSFEVRH